MRSPLLSVVFSLGVVVLWVSCSEEAGSARWVGRTYLLDIPAANWVQPPGVGRDIGDFVPQFLIGIQNGPSGHMAITLGAAGEGVQDRCSPTTQVTTSGASYPGVQIVAPEFPIRIVHPSQPVTVNTTIRDFSITDVLPGDAPAKEGQVTATIDIAEVYPLFTLIPNVTKEAVCTQLEAFGAACAVCAFNGQPFCLTIQAVELGASPSSTPVDPVSPGDIASSCSP